MLKQYRIRDYNFKLAIMVIALAVIGIITVGSAQESLQSKQILGFAFGVFLMLVLSLFDYSVIFAACFGNTDMERIIIFLSEFTVCLYRERHRRGF